LRPAPASIPYNIRMLDRRRFLSASAVAGASLFGIANAADNEDLAGLSLAEAAERVRRGLVSPVALTEACLTRIDRWDPHLNAFTTITAESALAAARVCEHELASGRSRGPLHGIPIALKDNIDTAGVRTTAAAAAFAQRVPTADAEVVHRLKRAGAIFLGKLNMDECAWGVATSTGAFGATHNPWKRGYIPGGSSGGPAAAVAARLCFAALGTDTGGSIRLPAAYCGVVGLKPTYGHVSARGVIPLSTSLDHVGPICRSVADTAIVLQAIAGPDTADSADRSTPMPDYLQEMRRDVSKLRIGRPDGNYFQRLDPEVATAVDAAIGVLGSLTAGVADAQLPAASGLGVLFVEAAGYYADRIAKSPDGFSAAIHSLAAAGGRVSADSYQNGLQQLRDLRRDVVRVFDNVDLLVTPTTPDLPMTIEASRRLVAQKDRPRSAQNTMPFNLYGLPALSIPCGFSRDRLPIGVQIIGPSGGEGRVLALAAAYEAQTAWHRQLPRLQIGAINPGAT